jgi:glycosyltransferase involved in cell wall biosynthesis
MTRRDILFVHNGFPAQFGFIASALKQRGMRCVAIGSEGALSPEIPIRAWSKPESSVKEIPPFVTRVEGDLRRGHAAAEVALRLRRKGFSPELIIGHPGWGETLLLSEVFPDAPQILHGEYYYRTEGGDFGFDPEFGKPNQEAKFVVASKNAGHAMAYAQAERIVSPTAFQARQFPQVLRDVISVIHEGVETDRIKRRKDVKLKLPSGVTLDGSVPVITFINRTLEALRGYHVFMRALPALLAAVPNAHVVIMGAAEGTLYGAAVKDNTWKDHLLAEVGDRLDMSRVHFTGRVSHDWMLDALSISWAHVYYTHPFVLSWSLLEAMACECFIIGSDTAPLHDAIEDGVTGRLLDFFDVGALSQAMIEACRKPKAFEAMRKAARRSVVARYDRATICQPAWMALIDEVLAGA